MATASTDGTPTLLISTSVAAVTSSAFAAETSAAAQLLQEGKLVEACEAYARALELSPVDDKVYVDFRRAVDELAVQLAQESATIELPDKQVCGPELGTVDLDLRFLGPKALHRLGTACRPQAGYRVSTARCVSTDGAADMDHLTLLEAVMRNRTANTGYMASAPPSQPLEHYFDLAKMKALGRSDRRVMCVDYERQELVLVSKEEEVKAYPFNAFSGAEPGAKLSSAGHTLRLTIAGEAAEWRVTAFSEVAAICTHAELIAEFNAAKRAGEAAPASPSPLVSRWVMSGTVEKEGKLRWASRWLVLTRGRLYVLRGATAQCPLNVIPINEEVKVRSGERGGFAVTTHERTYNFRTGDDGEGVDRWLSQLRAQTETVEESDMLAATVKDTPEISEMLAAFEDDDDRPDAEDAAAADAPAAPPMPPTRNSVIEAAVRRAG